MSTVQMNRCIVNFYDGVLSGCYSIASSVLKIAVGFDIFDSV